MDCLDGYDEQNCSKSENIHCVYVMYYLSCAVELGSPPEISVVEGREKDIQLCLTVTEVREHHIFRQYTFESIPFGKVNCKLSFVCTFFFTYTHACI